jgi:hypothetical protein
VSLEICDDGFRNWLNVGIRAEKVGNTFVVDRICLLSPKLIDNRDLGHVTSNLGIAACCTSTYLGISSKHAFCQVCCIEIVIYS